MTRRLICLMAVSGMLAAASFSGAAAPTRNPSPDGKWIEAINSLTCPLMLENPSFGKAKFDSIEQCYDCHEKNYVQPYVAQASEARLREAEALEKPRREFEAARAANTADAYRDFISKYPDSAYRAEAVKALAGIYLSMPESDRLIGEATSQYPDMIVFLPPNLRLRYIGPPGMQVFRIQELLQKGIGEKLIVTKIRAEKSGYKNFDLDEILQLKGMGLPESVIDEMIAATARAEAASENAELKAEIARLRQSIEDLQARQASAAAAGQQVLASAPQAPGMGETIANCASQVAALELCGQAPGGAIGQAICKAAAKNQFPCNQ